jgi:5-bromo-4-chloroindolyl phosphate hydrolysis protein
MALANVTIIRLEVQNQDIQVVSSWQQPLTEVRDILDIIDQSPQMLGL